MPQNDLRTLPHNQKSTTHKISKRLGYDFLANQSSKQMFFDKKKKLFFEQNQEMQKIKKLNRNNPNTYKMHKKQKKPCQKQEKKYIEEMKKIAEKQNCRNCLPGEACSTRKSSKG